MSDYYDDIATDVREMRWRWGPNRPLGSGWGASGDTQSLPIGLHSTKAQRLEQRLARHGIVVIRRGPSS